MLDYQYRRKALQTWAEERMEKDDEQTVVKQKQHRRSKPHPSIFEKVTTLLKAIQSHKKTSAS